MPVQAYTPEEMLVLLREETQRAGGPTKWAHGRDIAPSTVSDALSGRREIGETIGTAMGFVRRQLFIKVRKPGKEPNSAAV